MSTEIVAYQPGALSEEMDYARAVSTANMLPDNYRGKPADIMLAVGLGRSMGLSPAESLYRISVIKGKPTASAELIAANVRKAGHRLRVTSDGTSATCTIIRADDPEFPFEVTRDLAWAQRMGLAKNDNYAKQAETMLTWRAITACARIACPEALYGVAYTADEMDDSPRVAEVTAEHVNPAGARIADVIRAEPAEPVDAELVPPDHDTDAQRRAMFAAFADAGLPDARTKDGREMRLRYIAEVIGRPVESSNDMTWDERSHVLDALRIETNPA